MITIPGSGTSFRGSLHDMNSISFLYFQALVSDIIVWLLQQYDSSIIRRIRCIKKGIPALWGSFFYMFPRRGQHLPEVSSLRQ